MRLAVDPRPDQPYHPFMYSLEYAEDVADDIKEMRAGDRKRILDKIDE